MGAGLHRLPGSLEIDDRESPVTEPDTGLLPIALIVGATMDELIRHAAQQRRIDLTPI